MKQILLLLFLSISLSIAGQYDKALYSWESHLPQQIGKQVADGGEYIYYSTGLSVIRVAKEDNSGNFYSTVQGLTDTGISAIAYDEVGEQLVIAYNSGSLDFLQSDGTVINIADFKLNTTFSDKTINKIVISDNRRALFATRFGVVAQNLDTYFFDFTTNMETEVFEIAQQGNEICAATNEGIYQLFEGGIIIPDDFTVWNLLDGEVGLPALYECKDICFYNDEKYAIIDDEVYKSEDDQWTLLLEDRSQSSFIFLSSESLHLLIGSREGNFGILDAYNKNGEYIPASANCASSIVDAIETKEGAIWYADNWHGLRHQEGLNEACSQTFYNSPYSEKVREIRVKNGDAYIASGGINESFLFDNNRNGFYVEQDGNWTNYNGNTVTSIKQNNMLNFVVVQPHPSKNILYAGAFPGGLLEINLTNNEQFVYHSGNSNLKGPEASLDLERVVEAKFDENENLWVVTYNASEPLHVLTPQGVWHSYSFGNIRNLGAIEFDDFGNLWIQLAASSGGVLVFHHGGTLDNLDDDDYVKFNSANTEMTTNRVFSLKKDLEGEMWVGTENGPVVFECGDIFPSKDCRGSIRKVLQDSIPAPLLATEGITTIAIDGANRKWLGTGTGIYVQSASGEFQELRITTENSPLFDNSIIDLEYDAELGEMYIGTVKGVQSLRIDATGATQYFSSSNLYTFPNPVRPDYDGPIAIQGLARDSNVKITDMQGRLVYEATANGGIVTWNGYDYSGSKARAGVYLVYATYTKDLDNIETATTKFVIME